MNETIKSMDDNTLWSLHSDLSNLMENRKQKGNDKALLFWYQIHKEIVSEIDRRIIKGA